MLPYPDGVYGGGSSSAATTAACLDAAKMHLQKKRGRKNYLELTVRTTFQTLHVQKTQSITKRWSDSSFRCNAREKFLHLEEIGN